MFPDAEAYEQQRLNGAECVECDAPADVMVGDRLLCAACADDFTGGEQSRCISAIIPHGNDAPQSDPPTRSTTCCEFRGTDVTARAMSIMLDAAYKAMEDSR